MPPFSYKAKDKTGKVVTGTIDADARGSVISRLQQMGYYPISIEAGGRKVVAKAEAATPAPAAKMPKLPSLGRKGAKPGEKARDATPSPTKAAAAPGGGRRRRIKTADIATFNRQLADLLGAGIALVKALTILTRQTANESLRDVILEVNSDVQGGATFADALSRHPKNFSKLYVAMVRSGEAGGMLDEVLARLADFSEQEEALKGRIISALAYPAVMIVAGFGAVIVMFAYVVPKIVATFTQLNQTLPAITQLLISISSFVQNYWFFVIGALGAGGFAFWQFTRSERGLLLWHETQLKLPIFGSVIQKREVARFARTLGSLIKNGVPILTALGITREVVNNTLVRAEVEKITEELTQGASIAEPLKNSKVFPSVTVNMLAVGEETGQLPQVLLRISDSFEMEVDRQVKTLTSLIEPLIIVVMGLVVGFIVIAMLVPIFTLDPTANA
jgi:type II secretion system protein F